jgi:hypothetical protein
MSRSLLVTAAAAIAIVGCGMTPAKVGEPVAVSGKVALANGQPVRDVLLVLNPVEKGRPDSFKLAPDGSFRGNVVPGKYAFYFAPPDGRPAPAALRVIPEKFRSHQVEKLVTISGGAVTITVD